MLTPLLAGALLAQERDLKYVWTEYNDTVESEVRRVETQPEPGKLKWTNLVPEQVKVGKEVVKVLQKNCPGTAVITPEGRAIFDRKLASTEWFYQTGETSPEVAAYTSTRFLLKAPSEDIQCFMQAPGLEGYSRLGYDWCNEDTNACYMVEKASSHAGFGGDTIFGDLGLKRGEYGEYKSTYVQVIVASMNPHKNR